MGAREEQSGKVECITIDKDSKGRHKLGQSNSDRQATRVKYEYISPPFVDLFRGQSRPRFSSGAHAFGVCCHVEVVAPNLGSLIFPDASASHPARRWRRLPHGRRAHSRRPHRAKLWRASRDAFPAASAALAQRAACARHTPRAGGGARCPARPHPQTGAALLLSIMVHKTSIYFLQSDTVQALRGDPDSSEAEHVRIMLVQTEVERVKFVVRSYIRTRLHKASYHSHF